MDKQGNIQQKSQEFESVIQVEGEDQGIKFTNGQAVVFLDKQGNIQQKSQEFESIIKAEGEDQGIKFTSGDSFIFLKKDGAASINVTELTLKGNLVHEGNTNQTGDIVHEGNTNQTGNVSHEGDTNQKGTMSVDGKMESQSIKAAGKELAGHVHGSGTLMTDKPVSGSTGQNV